LVVAIPSPSNVELVVERGYGWSEGSCVDKRPLLNVAIPFIPGDIRRVAICIHILFHSSLQNVVGPGPI
jgi:hypothetical protein